MAAADVDEWAGDDQVTVTFKVTVTSRVRGKTQTLMERRGWMMSTGEWASEGRINMENDKSIKASALINRFRALVEHAETIVFPATKASIFLPINMETWLPVRSLLYKASSPYLYLNRRQKGDILYFLLTLFILAMSFSTLVLAQKIAQEVPISADWLRFVFLTIYLFLSLYGMLSFLRDNRYSAWVRVIIFLILTVTSMVFSGTLFSVNFAGTHVITSFGRYFEVLLLSFSVLSFLSLSLINTFLVVLLASIQLIKFTKTVQTPIANDVVENLLHAEIHSGEGNEQTWCLLDLSKNEISYLRLWSDSSLNSSEKRTTPAIVVVAFISLLLSIDGIRNFLTSIFRISPVFNAQSWLQYLILIIALAFMSIFSETMVAIFKNIAVQSLVVESCLVAEYAAVESQETSLRQSNNLLSSIFTAVVRMIIK